jgi:hypothetical protein
MKRHFEPFRPNQEQLAFLYQQTQELEAYSAPLGSLTMLVEEHSPIAQPEDKTFGVTFLVAPETMKFRIRVEGPDLFEVCILAKEEAKLKLNSLMNALPKEVLLGREDGKSKSASHVLH